MNLDFDSISRSPFTVGALGAFVALRFVPGASWPERAFNLVAGALCGGYCGPALSDWLHIAMESVRGGVAFLIGMFGLSLAAAVMQAVREGKLADVIAGWLTRR